MGKIVFENCRVTINGQQQLYKTFEFLLEEVAEMKIDGQEKECHIKSLSGDEMVIQYYGKAPIL